MTHLRVPHTDLSASCIAHACANLAPWDANSLWSEDQGGGADQLIHPAVEQGITLFDGADLYAFGKAETRFGEVLEASPALRQKIILQSKRGQMFSPDFQ
jgi:aryl-alcohol dehydrogenase-like predicted oxidoreductase